VAARRAQLLVGLLPARGGTAFLRSRRFAYPSCSPREGVPRSTGWALPRTETAPPARGGTATTVSMLGMLTPCSPGMWGVPRSPAWSSRSSSPAPLPHVGVPRGTRQAGSRASSAPPTRGGTGVLGHNAPGRLRCSPCARGTANLRTAGRKLADCSPCARGYRVEGGFVGGLLRLLSLRGGGHGVAEVVLLPYTWGYRRRGCARGVGPALLPEPPWG
jgi:hypothetical protein